MIKQMKRSIAVLGLLCAGSLYAATTIGGEVTLNSELLDKIDTCSGNHCPFIEVETGYWDSTEERYYSYVAPVDYNDTSGKYEYSLLLDTNATVTNDTEWYININIGNGDMGDEYLYYSFGEDKLPGGEGNNTDSVMHDDFMDGSAYPLFVAADTDSMSVPLDISSKNDGRRKVTARFKMPVDMQLDETDENGIYINNLWVDLSASDSSVYTWGHVMNQRDDDGNYTMITSIRDLPAVQKLSLHINGELNGYNVSAYYQIGTDPDDHQLDGNEQLLTGWGNPAENYVDFNTSAIDFGVVDVATYLQGYKVLQGAMIPPNGYLTTGEYASISIAINGNDSNMWLGGAWFEEGYPAPDENGTYYYKLLVPQDMQNKISSDGGVKYTLYFDWSENGQYKYYNTYYDFGDDNAPGGEGSNEDQALSGCFTRDDATPFIPDFSAELPAVDVNLSDYVVPNVGRADIYIKANQLHTAKGNVIDLGYWLTDMTCNETEMRNNWSWFEGNDEEGTAHYVVNGLVEGHDYALNTTYRLDTNDTQWYRYVVNDNDGNFTNGGAYNDEIEVDDNGNVIYSDTLALLSGGMNTLIPEIDFRWNHDVTTPDFNADGVADVLWMNSSDNKTHIWYMNSDGTHTTQYTGKRYSGYDVQGVADFNADGVADVLWMNSSDNKTHIWYMNSDGTHTTQYTGKRYSGYDVVSR